MGYSLIYIERSSIMTEMQEYTKIKAKIRKLEGKKEKGDKTNHILHLLLSILTAGFWIPVWILVSLSSSGISESEIDKLYEKKDELEFKLKK